MMQSTENKDLAAAHQRANFAWMIRPLDEQPPEFNKTTRDQATTQRVLEDMKVVLRGLGAGLSLAEAQAAVDDGSEDAQEPLDREDVAELREMALEGMRDAQEELAHLKADGEATLACSTDPATTKHWLDKSIANELGNIQFSERLLNAYDSFLASGEEYWDFSGLPTS
jgi:hypothetical protein